MLRNKALLSIFLLFLITKISSQTPSYCHYTASDGLASSTIYDMIQDKNGYMWFATANGVSKFDGIHFKTYRTKDGLNSNSIISLIEDHNGAIYFGNFEKGLNVYKDGKIENYYSEINGKDIIVSNMILDTSTKDEHKIIAYYRWNAIYFLNKNELGKPIASVINPLPLAINKIEKLQNGDLVALTTTGLFNFKDGLFSKLKINDLPETSIISLAKGKNGSYFLGTKGMMYHIKNNAIIKKYPIKNGGNNIINTILFDKNDNIWFTVLSHGIYFIPKGSDKKIDIGEKLGLNHTQINKIFEDNEGNIWFCTYGKGIYYINNQYLKNQDENDGLSNNDVYSIAKDKSGRLFFGTFNGVNVLEHGKFKQLKYLSNKLITEYIYNIKVFNNELYISAALTKRGIIDSYYQNLKIYLTSYISFYKLRNGLYLFGDRTNYINIQKAIRVEKNQIIKLPIFGAEFNSNRINQFFEDSKNNVWIGSTLGLCKAQIFINESDHVEIKKTFYPSNPVLNSKINAIIQDQTNHIWIAGEKGVVSYNLKNDSIVNYPTLGAFDLSSSTSLATDSKNNLWIGNMKGLYEFNGKTIMHLNNQTGLPSNEIYALLYDSKKNQLVVGSSGGVSFIDINLFDKQISPQLNVTINSIKAGDSVFTDFNHLNFNPKQRDVTLSFKSLYFSSPGSIKYQYQLNDKHWKETDQDFLDFISLKNGTYQLQIRAKSQNSTWGAPTQISFILEPRFSETIWFQFLILMALGIGFVIIFTWLLIKKQKKIREELNLNERINALKHQALSAMMNPHFIFNALNSVQYLINCKRNEEANNYIAMMAKLIRKNLDTAGDRFIFLSDEISRLELYLNLEKLRLQDGFSYEIITATNVDLTNTKIPNMIIQPFVENTLWHGIINSGNKGLVSISFSFENVELDSTISKSLIIKIADNGIGIIEAKKHQKDNHISKGIEIIKERLRLLSEKMQLPQPIMFKDLSNQNNQSHGTEVIISLPLPLYQVIVPLVE